MASIRPPTHAYASSTLDTLLRYHLYSTRRLSRSHLTVSRTIDSQLVSLNVSFVGRVPFDPFEIRLDSQSIPFLDLGKHVLNDVLVLNCLSSRVLPTVPSPIDIPVRDTIYGVFRIGNNSRISISWYYF